MSNYYFGFQDLAVVYIEAILFWSIFQL